MWTPERANRRPAGAIWSISEGGEKRIDKPPPPFLPHLVATETPAALLLAEEGAREPAELAAPRRLVDWKKLIAGRRANSTDNVIQ